MAEELGEGFYEVPFEVEPNYAGWRLDLYLCEKIPRLSRAHAQRIIRQSLRAERALKPSSPVRPGLRFWLRRKVLDEPPTSGAPLGILHQDAHLLAVDKPADLPIHPTARYFKGTLVARLREMAGPGEKLDPAHRLDRETSGIVLCGKAPEATRRLKAQFAAGEVRKAYLAVVEGEPSHDQWEIDAPLAVGGEVVRIKALVDRGGKEAATGVEVLGRYRDTQGQPFALVRARPRTGRQHQIRAHLAHAGLPLVGDKIYGPDERYFVRFAAHAPSAGESGWDRLGEEARARLRLPRHALHAAEVEFAHPVTGARLRIESPLPMDLRAFLGGLRPA